MFASRILEKLENKKRLGIYNHEFSYAHETIHELNEHLNNNRIGKNSRTPIKQIIAKSNYITIAIGIDEFASKSLTEKITTETIDNYINEMNTFLKNTREFYNDSIVVLGVYPANKFNKKDAIEVNSKLKILCGKYNALFLDVLAFSLHDEYYLEKSSYYMNYKAHQEIAKELFLMYKNN